MTGEGNPIVVETICPAPADMLEASAIKYLGDERGRAHLKIMEGSAEEWGTNLGSACLRRPGSPDRRARIHSGHPTTRPRNTTNG